MSDYTSGRDALRIGSLFSGYGGLEQGVQTVLGGTVAWHSEIDPGACKILAHRYPHVPNLGDITAVDWSAVEPVDVLCGGFPCQDVSAAGKRAGIRPGTRSGLWTQFAYAIDQLRPRLVVIENVRGLLSADAHHPAHGDLEPCPWCVGDDDPVLLRALGAVLGDLAELGFDAEWVGLRAADVGAPHGRFRVFVVAWPAGADTAAFGRWAARGDDGVRSAGLVAGAVAHAEDDGRKGSVGRRSEPQRSRAASGRGGTSADSYGATRGERRLPAPGQAEGGWPRADAGRRGAAPAPYTEGDGRYEGRPEPARQLGGSDASLGGRAPADSDGDGLDRLEELHSTAQPGREAVVERDDPHGLAVAAGGLDWGAYGPAVRRWERRLGRPAPPPTERGKNGQPRLSPAFVEWLMGLPAGWVTDVPGLTRNEQLKALGNGVVPQQAAEALRILLARTALDGAA